MTTLIIAVKVDESLLRPDKNNAKGTHANGLFSEVQSKFYKTSMYTERTDAQLLVQ